MLIPPHIILFRKIGDTFLFYNVITLNNQYEETKRSTKIYTYLKCFKAICVCFQKSSRSCNGLLCAVINPWSTASVCLQVWLLGLWERGVTTCPPPGVLIWDIFPRKSSLNDRARLASLVLLKEALCPPGPEPAKGEEDGVSFSEKKIRK